MIKIKKVRDNLYNDYETVKQFDKQNYEGGWLFEKSSESNIINVFTYYNDEQIHNETELIAKLEDRGGNFYILNFIDFDEQFVLHDDLENVKYKVVAICLTGSLECVKCDVNE